jgi:hypothetical protein
MSETDLLNLGRSITANEVSWLGQVITINFAMVVGIYYFLSRAGLALKAFAFIAYLLGMLLYLGEILLESNLRSVVLTSLKALPHASPIAQEYVGLSESWLGYTTLTLFNGAFWILAIGVFYLLFFWKKAPPAAESEMRSDR